MNSRKQFGIDIINDCLLDDCYLTQKCIDCCNKEGRKYIAKYTPSVEILLQVIEQSSGKGLIKPNNIVTSSGSVLVMIFDDFVLKLYQSSSTWNKVVDILERTYECPYVINMRNFVSIENGNKDGSDLDSLLENIKNIKKYSFAEPYWYLARAYNNINHNELAEECHMKSKEILKNNAQIITNPHHQESYKNAIYNKKILSDLDEVKIEEADKIVIFSFCPSCGFKNENNFAFCPSCGSDLKQ